MQQEYANDGNRDPSFKGDWFEFEDANVTTS